jgi:hypothetical protein
MFKYLRELAVNVLLVLQVSVERFGARNAPAQPPTHNIGYAGTVYYDPATESIHQGHRTWPMV